jgi:hypothetical protein
MPKKRPVGRPTLGEFRKERCHCSLSPDVKKWLDAQEKTNSHLIEKALLNTYGIRAPKVSVT